MYTSSDDEFTADERPPSKRGKVAGKRGGGMARGSRKRVRSYC